MPEPLTNKCPSVLSYAPAPQTSSPYAITALCISIAITLCVALNIFLNRQGFEIDDLIDGNKQERIGYVASILCMILTWAAYRQKQHKRELSHIALGVSILAFFVSGLLHHL
ncbi:MAG TPA: hypothetical protein VHD56_07465 [Tepidisphaeraceae bacterium]|nr:hypothetical protein [Tepidisphaeraceae bacterium]